MAIAAMAVVVAAVMSFGLTVTQSATGISVTVETTGAYTVTTTTPAWTFGGNLAKTLTNVTQVDATDKIGAYTGITFNLTGTGALQGTIRLYQSIPVVMFSMKTLASMATLGVNFPDFSTYPSTGMLYMGQQHNTFAVPTFTLSSIGSDAALVAYNAQGQTFVFSTADHFWEVSNTYNGALRSTIKSWATPLPLGWDHQTILAVGTGINHTCDVWGQGLRGYYGKPVPSNQAEIPMKTFGYWTDNFAGYYYYVDSKYANYEAEMMAVKAMWDTYNIKMGYLMLDSWWYLKSCSPTWNSVGSGIYIYRADPAVFPSGLNGFHNKIGLPFVTHHRWYQNGCSPATPIVGTYGLSGGLPLQYNAWKDIVYKVADSGSICFEQDWLDNNALVAQHISDLDSAMGNMAKACKDKNMTQHYCMPLPMYYQQAAKYPTLTAIRSTNDGYRQSFWDPHVFNSRFAWSMGMYPWVDCFPSTNNQTGCLLSCVLAGAYFAPSDRIGVEVIGNILPATRRDGILVKTLVPALPTEQTYISYGQSKAANAVTFTYSEHENLFKTFYVWIEGANATSCSFNPVSEGFPALANGMYAYNWFAKTGRFVASGSPLLDTCASGTNSFHYWVVAPAGPSGIAFLGDLSKYVSCGIQRITSLVHSAGGVTATVDLESQEASDTISGYAPTKPTVVECTTNNATLGTLNYTNSRFSVVVTPSAGARTPMGIYIGYTTQAHPIITANKSPASVSFAKGKLFVDMGTRCNFTLRIFNMRGQVCYSTLVVDQRMMVLSQATVTLKQGTYMAEIKSVGAAQALHLVKKFALQ
jgi:hypothetical protein